MAMQEDALVKGVWVLRWEWCSCFIFQGCPRRGLNLALSAPQELFLAINETEILLNVVKEQQDEMTTCK